MVMSLMAPSTILPLCSLTAPEAAGADEAAAAEGLAEAEAGAGAEAAAEPAGAAEEGFAAAADDAGAALEAGAAAPPPHAVLKKSAASPMNGSLKRLRTFIASFLPDE